MLRALNLAVALGLIMVSPLPAQARKDHDAARQAMQSGEIRSLGEIRSRVGSQIRGELIGSDLNLAARRYRLRYLREGSVIEVDVDARTGSILDVQGD